MVSSHMPGPLKTTFQLRLQARPADQSLSSDSLRVMKPCTWWEIHEDTREAWLSLLFPRIRTAQEEKGGFSPPQMGEPPLR